jgi:hypothetical protein
MYNKLLGLQAYLRAGFAVVSSSDKDPIPQAVAIRRLRTVLTPAPSTTKVERASVEEN